MKCWLLELQSMKRVKQLLLTYVLIAKESKNGMKCWLLELQSMKRVKQLLLTYVLIAKESKKYYIEAF